MSTLITRIQDLATRVATEFKSVRTLINGNQASLSSLTTANNTTLVSAINELRANTQYLGTLAANAAGINDGSTSNTSTWSSNNINTKIVTVNTAVTTLTSNVGNLNTTVSNQTANIATLFNNTSVLTTNVSTLFSNVSVLTTNVATLFSNVSVLTTNVATLFSNVSTLNTSLATKATINDGVTNTSVTWSSNNINNQIVTVNTALTTLTSNVANLNTTVSNQTANIATLFSNTATLTTNVATLFSNVSTLNTSLASKAVINDGVTNTSVTWSSNNIYNQIAVQVAAVVNNAPGALATLAAIDAQLANDESTTATIVTGLTNRVRTDTASQGLTTLQQSNARTNILALSTVEIGTPDTDFTVTFNAGLL